MDYYININAELIILSLKIYTNVIVSIDLGILDF
jgi:hypothetical protein